jgi:hypothetical protein
MQQPLWGPRIFSIVALPLILLPEAANYRGRQSPQPHVNRASENVVLAMVVQHTQT